MASLLDVYEYNQHFVAMMNIINNARLNPPIKGHVHHIVPKCWFKLNNLEIDNSKDNLVLLSYEDHIKVHKLTILCSKDDNMKSKMGYAVHRLTKGDIHGIHHTIETKKLLSNINKGKKLTNETKAKISSAVSGKNNPMYGKVSAMKGKVSVMKGKHFNAEHNRKVSEALHRRWAKIKETNNG